MRPLIVSDSLCSISLIDSNWTDSSNIKDINHPLTSFFNWIDRTKQTNPLPPIRDDRTSHLPPQAPVHPLRNVFQFPKCHWNQFDPPLPPWILHVSTDIHCTVLQLSLLWAHRFRSPFLFSYSCPVARWPRFGFDLITSNKSKSLTGCIPKTIPISIFIFIVSDIEVTHFIKSSKQSLKNNSDYEEESCTQLHWTFWVKFISENLMLKWW